MILATLLALSMSSQLSIGDPAPPLGYGSVIKGQPVRAFGANRVTVVEFWATWCKPCIEIMPHLSGLWRKYGDRVDFVSVNVMENEPAKVPSFVAKMGDKLAYPVVADKLDKGKGFMQARWLEAAKQNAIPVAFIVGQDNRIAWIGNPSSLDAVLPKVVEGTWDAKAYKIRFDNQRKDEAASARLLEEGFGRILATPRTRSYRETVAWIDRNRSKYEGPDTLAALDECRRLFEMFEKRDFEGALKASEADPASGFVWTYLRPMLLVARLDALQSLKRDWREVVVKVIDGPPDPNILMNLVDALTLPDSRLAETDAGLSLKLAEKLVALAQAPIFLRRLAWAYFANGQADKAIATVDEALAGMDEEKKRNPHSYAETLTALKEAKTYFSKSNRQVRSSSGNEVGHSCNRADRASIR
jgi:thiol-disulfide isomerase/thioredoxin